MKRQFIFTLVIILLVCISADAQTIIGKVTDQNHQPIESASVVLQSPDSATIAATITNPDGSFTFQQGVVPYRIIIQHIAYQTKIISGKETSLGNIVMEERADALQEVVVKASRPFVKVENGKLGYDLSVLSERKAVNNAYEALKELPGIHEDKGVLTLAGATNLNILINDKPTTMTYDQLATMLRSMPVDRVKKAEVMYSTPHEYHVRGASINVLLKQADSYSLLGEVKSSYTNKYFNYGSTGGSFRITTPKMGIDLMYDAVNIKDATRLDLDSRHTYQNKLYEIIQDNKIAQKRWNHNIRSAFEYNFSEKSNINIAYTGQLIPHESSYSKTTGNYQTSLVDGYEKDQLHNISMQYKSSFGLSLGSDFTHYHSSTNRHLNSLVDDETNAFALTGGQNINKISFTADQEHNLNRNWNIGYGMSYANAHDEDNQNYTDIKGSLETENTNSKLTEQTTDFYFKVGKSYQTGPSFSLSASGEYYTIGNYHKWAFYPQASLTYFTNPKHIFVLGLSSNKTYPDYWSMQSSVTYIDSYTEIVGKSDLRPCTNYSLTGTYLLNRKYSFTFFYQNMKDYLQQAAYQSSQKLILIYQTRNWNFSRQWGATAEIPFKIGDWLDSRFNVVGVRMREKCDDYFDIPFDRSKWLAQISLDNTFNISKNIFFNLNGRYVTPPIQGTYDAGHVFEMNTSAKWNFAKGKATLSAQLNDIFETSIPKIKVRFKGQNLDMNTAYYLRALTISFVYRFGGYKEKEQKLLDTSRFGHK